MKRGSVDAALAAVVFWLAYLGYASTIPALPEINVDTVRSLLAALDCVEGRGCLLRLNSAQGGSILGLHHGGLFNHLLVMLQLLGLRPQAGHTVLAAGAAAATALTALAARRLWGYAAGLFAAMALFHLQMSTHPLSLDVLWNANATPLPAALFIVAACAYLETSRSAYLAIAGFAVGVGVQLHLSCGTQALGLAYLVWAGPPGGRRRAAALTAFAAALTVVLGSPGMLLPASWPTFGGAVERGPVPVFLLALAAAAAVVAARAEPRRATRLLVCCAPLYAAVLLLAPGEHRYVYPLLPAVALLLTSAAVALWRSWSKVVLTLGLVMITLSSYARVSRPERKGLSFSLSDAAALSAVLAGQRGWSYGDAFRHLRGGNDYWDMLQGLAYFMPDPAPGHAAASVREDVVVFKVDAAAVPAALPPGWVSLASSAGARLLARAYLPLLQWSEARYCALAEGAQLSCRWTPLRYEFLARAHEGDEALRLKRGYTSVGMSWPGAGLVALKVPLRLPAGQPPRTLTVVGPDPSRRACRAAIAAVRGAAFSGSLPSSSVVVRGGRTAAKGDLTMVWDPNSCLEGMNMALPPMMLEFDEADRGVLPAVPAGSWAPEVAKAFAAGKVLTSEGDSPSVQESGPWPKEPLAPRAYVLTVFGAILVGLAVSFAACARWAAGSGLRA